MTPKQIQRLDYIIEALLLLFLIYGPLAFGSVSPHRRAPALLVALALLALTVFRLFQKQPGSVRTIEPRSLHKAYVALFFFGLFLLVILFQLTPLPRPAARILAVSGAVIDGFYAPIHPVPEAGIRALMTYLAAVSIFFVIVFIYREQAQVRRLTYTIIGIGVFEALYGLLEWISGHQHIFGYAKKAYTNVATGTFINRNHFAGYLEMALGMLIGTAIYVYTKSRKKKGLKPGGLEKIIILGFAAVLCISAMLASGSRAAPIALTASVLCAGTFFVQPKHRKKYFLFAVILSAVALVFCFWIGADPLNPRYKGLAEEIHAGDTRPRVFLATMKMWMHAPIFGVGAGAFADAFPLYRPSSILAFYDHAHNDYLEIIAETGILGFLSFSAAVIFTVISIVRARADRSSRFARSYSLGALIGLFSIGFHGFLDFNLAVPGNLWTFFALLGCGLVTADRHLSRTS